MPGREAAWWDLRRQAQCADYRAHVVHPVAVHLRRHSNECRHGCCYAVGGSATTSPRVPPWCDSGVHYADVLDRVRSW